MFTQLVNIYHFGEHFLRKNVFFVRTSCSLKGAYMSAAKSLGKNPNDFTMVTRGYWADIRSLSKRSPIGFQILTLLTERMNRTNAVVISQATLCQILGYGRTAVHTAIKLLAAEQWVQVVKIGTSNGYIVNSKVVWRDQGGKRYASFYAEVVVSETEQEHAVEAWDNIELRNVPILRVGEVPIDDGADLPPPDQKDLLPPDPLEFPRLRQSDQDELEAPGQQRLVE
jgi:hypothetical protein